MREEGSPHPGPLPVSEGEGRTKMVNFLQTSWPCWAPLAIRLGRLLAGHKPRQPSPGPLPVGEGAWRTKMVNLCRHLGHVGAFGDGLVGDRLPGKTRQPSPGPSQWARSMASKMVNFMQTSWPCWAPLAIGLVGDACREKPRQPSPRPSPSGRGLCSALGHVGRLWRSGSSEIACRGKPRQPSPRPFPSGRGRRVDEDGQVRADILAMLGRLGREVS